MSEPLWQPRTDLAARLLGFGFFLGGAVLLGYQAKVILDAAAAHVERVSYFASAIAMGEMGVGLGAYWIVRGLSGYAVIRTLKTDPVRMRNFLIVVAVLALASVVGMSLWLTSLGFDQ